MHALIKLKKGEFAGQNWSGDMSNVCENCNLQSTSVFGKVIQVY